MFDSQLAEHERTADELEYLGRIHQLNYIRLKVLCQAFNETYTVFLSFLLYTMVGAIIGSTYLVLRSARMPLILQIMVCLGGTFYILLGYYILSQATEAHLISKQFLQVSRTHSGDPCQAGFKFWKGMRPLRTGAGNVCTFETKEFILFLFGDVIMSTLIDILRAF